MNIENILYSAKGKEKRSVLLARVVLVHHPFLVSVILNAAIIKADNHLLRTYSEMVWLSSLNGMYHIIP